jgi:hypothetical protein
MNSIRTLVLVLPMSAIAISAAAQQAAPPQIADRFVPASLGSIAPPSSTSVESAPVPSPLLRAATPPPPSQHKFFDRQQLLALYVHSGVRLADTIKTCRSISHGGTEDWIPTQSCAGIATWQVGSVGLTLGVGWIFHHYGHHTLERLTPWVATGASAAGLTKSVFNIR